LELGYATGIVVDEEMMVAALEMADPMEEPQLARMLELHNGERRARGLRGLLLNIDLADAAQRHAEDMLRRGYFSHTSQDGTLFYQRITREGYRYARCAENIAWGSGSRGSPDSIFRGWMMSSGHKTNIINVNLKEVGFGVALGSYRGTRNVSMWVADFGTRR
jgi:uncharacterized protein YkwD